MNFKKSLCLLLVCLMVLPLFAACGDAKKPNETEKTDGRSDIFTQNRGSADCGGVELFSLRGLCGP